MSWTPNADATALSCPYPGLRPFRADETVVYFGRDEQVDELLERLGSRRFLAVVGTSGCGKSSLVFAGLIPALGTGLMGSAGARWAVAAMRPGGRPLWRLAEALLDPTVLGPSWSDLDYPTAQLNAALQRGPLGLAEVLDETPLPDGRKLLLLVDQFEEIFRYRREGEGQRDEANAFVALLLATARETDRSVYIVLTMRSDYLGDCSLFDGLPEVLNDSQFLTPKLTRTQRQQAIEGPARVFDGRVEPALVARLLNDMGSDPDQLPLMQHALMRLWKGSAPASDGACELTLAAYESLGGLEGALSGQADAAYESLDPERKQITEVLFRRLSERTTAGREIRRPTRLEEVARVAEATPEAVCAVVDVFRDPDRSFLTPPWPRAIRPDDILDISHESLIRHWGRLRAWVGDEAASAEVYRRLDQTARLWSEGHAGLWGSPDLDQALRWREQARPNAAWAARYGGDFDRAIRFLDASVAERERQQAEEQKRLDEQVEKNRLLAEAQRQRAEEAEARKREAEAAARRQKKLSQGFLSAAAVSLLLALAAGLQTWRANRASAEAQTAAGNAKWSATREKEAREEAEKNASLARQNEERAKAQTLIATSRQLAALSASERNKRLDISLLLAAEALRAENTFEARGSLVKALQDRPGLKSFLHSREGNVLSVAFSPDGTTLAAGYGARVGGGVEGGGVVLWDAAEHDLLAEDPLPVREGNVRSVAFSPDGKTLAAGYQGRSGSGVVLWDVAARNRLAEDPLPVKEGYVLSIAFSPDGKTLAAGYGYGRFGVEGGGVVLWDVAARQRRAEDPLPVKGGYVRSIAFSPDGKTLAAGVSVGWIGDVVLWDVAARKRLAEDPLPVNEGSVRSITFSPDGTTLAAGYARVDAGGVVLWDVAARQRLAEDPLPVSEGQVGSVAFSPDGKTLAAGYSASGDVGGMVLWDVAARKRLAEAPLLVNEGGIQSVAFSPDGTTIAARYEGSVSGGGVVLWEVAARQRLAEDFFPVGGNVQRVTFSPDGTTLAAGIEGRFGGGGGVVLWDVAARRRLAEDPLLMREGGVQSVAIGPDGKTLAAGYQGRSGSGVVLWDVATRPPRRLAEVPLPVKGGYQQDVAFSPDGRTLAIGYNLYDGGRVVLWDVAARRPLAEDPLPASEGSVWSIAFSRDGRTLAAGYGVAYGGGSVVLWDVAARRRLAEVPLPVKEGGVKEVAFSPDRKTLATGYDVSGRGRVVLWDVTARRRLAEAPLPVSEGNVGCVAFSPDGTTLAAGYGGTDDGGVVLWDVAARKRLVEDPLLMKGGYLQSVAFSPDGKTLAAGYSVAFGNGGVVLWDVDLESWQHRAGLIANRNFTRDEWRQYFPDVPYRATFPELPVPPEVPANDGTGRR